MSKRMFLYRRKTEGGIWQVGDLVAVTSPAKVIRLARWRNGVCLQPAVVYGRTFKACSSFIEMVGKHPQDWERVMLLAEEVLADAEIDKDSV